MDGVAGEMDNFLHDPVPLTQRDIPARDKGVERLYVSRDNAYAGLARPTQRVGLSNRRTNAAAQTFSSNGG